MAKIKQKLKVFLKDKYLYDSVKVGFLKILKEMKGLWYKYQYIFKLFIFIYSSF